MFALQLILNHKKALINETLIRPCDAQIIWNNTCLITSDKIPL